MPRLLYLCVHPRNRSPSQRYRFEQFEPYLTSKGFEIDYSPALSAEDIPVFYGDASIMRKASISLRALLRRAWSVAPRGEASRYDVVLVQREAFFLLDAWSEWIAQLQAPLVFDFDDAIWIHGVSEANRRFGLLKNVKKISRIVAMSTAVIAGNDFLGHWARRYNPAVEIVPTCVDTDRYTPPTVRSSDTVTIGWCGSPSTIAHLRPILPALERVKGLYGDRVNIRVMGDPRFVYAPLNLVGEPWSSDAEIAFLRSMDIGLMPLPDDEWSKGKCGLKGLTSMACGAATVMSPVGVNVQIVQNGINGFLPRTNEEWFSVLAKLVDDAPLRARVGAAGRATVLEGYSVARWRAPLCEILETAMNAQSRR